MNWRQVRIFFIAITAILVIIFFLMPKQPGYQGRRLTDWLSAYRESVYHENGSTTTAVDTKTAEQAIRVIGTNAIPVLLKLASSEDSVLKSDMIDLLKYFRLPVRPDDENRSLAVFGFN